MSEIALAQVLTRGDSQMNHLGIGGLFVCLISFLIGSLIYSKNRKIFLNQIFFLFCLCVATFGLGFFLVDTAPSKEFALLWWKYMYFGVIFITVTFLHVCLEFCKIKKRTILYFLYPLYFIFLFFNFTSRLFFRSVSWKFSNIWYADAGNIFIYFVIIWWITVGYGLFLVYDEYRKTSGARHSQSKIWLLSFIIGFCGGIFCYLPIFNINAIYPYSIYLIAVWPVTLYIGFSKYHLFEVQTIAHKTILWLFTYSIVFLPVCVIVWVISSGSLYLSLIIPVLFYLFLRFYIVLQPKIDHAFRRRKYDYQTLLGKISEKIATCISVEQLTHQLLTEVCETMYLRNGVFYLISKDEQKYKLIARRGYQGKSSSMEIFDDSSRREIKSNIAEINIHESILSCAWINDSYDIIDKERIETEDRFASVKNIYLPWANEQAIELLVPIIFQKTVVGLLGLGSKENLQPYMEKDKQLLRKLGWETGVTFFNAMHYKDVLEKERLEDEVKMGQKIQMDLMPHGTPNVIDLDIAGYMHPAKEIGGDYFDFIARPYNNEFAFVIGDVAGKGVAAGIVMSMLKMAVNTLSQQMFGPKEILSITNISLYQQVRGEKFASVLYFLWHPQERRLIYSSAGHEHILVYRSKEKRVEAIKSGGIVLGMLPEVSELLEETSLALDHGDKILLYTDGVTDAKNEQGERYELNRLREMFQKYCSLPPTEMILSINTEILTYMGDTPQYDDITLLALEAKFPQKLNA